MPLNKLENFIKNTDGRTLYVNPADLNATDSITNQGTSLTEPFRTVQRALIEAARFSYVRGEDNDLIEKTTIILYPGEHTIDNRPGYGVRISEGTGDPVAVDPSGQERPVRELARSRPPGGQAAVRRRRQQGLDDAFQERGVAGQLNLQRILARIR